MGNDTIRRRQPVSVLAGCALLSCLALDAARSSADAADQVKIGISRTISDAGYYMADAMGFFREEGMEVSITGFNSAAQMIAPLGTGELDVGGGTVSAGFYNAVGRGILMKIVADQASIKPGYGYSSLMVRKDLVDSGRYKSFADLKGMKVAIGAPGTGTASALNEALKKGGLRYSDVDVVYIGFPEHLPTYKNKGIDASITNEPTMTRAIEDGVAVRVAGNDVTSADGGDVFFRPFHQEPARRGRAIHARLSSRRSHVQRCAQGRPPGRAESERGHSDPGQIHHDQG
jgi:NitT/TauT family transport system substrate-binding protein